MLRVGFFGVGLLLVQTACSGSDSSDATPRPRNTTAVEPNQGNSGGSGGIGGAAGSAGTEQAGTAGIPIVSFGPLGTTCSDAVSCAERLHCFAAAGSDFPTYGPAGGYCSKRCTDHSDCSAIDEGAFCVDLFLGDDQVPARICAPSCKLGDRNACGQRADLACWPIEDTSVVAPRRACLPTCNHDDLCPAGTVCDGYVNLCASTAPGGGKPLGSACNPAATSNLCGEGFCLELFGGGVCSAYCRRGTFPQCGNTAGENSICGWVFPGDEDAGLADIGMCASTCACDADCVTGTRCVLHGDRHGMTHPGICTVGAATGIATCPG